MDFNFVSSRGSLTVSNKPQNNFIINRIEGLGMPEIRTSKQNYSGTDGGRVNAQFYSQRLISITGYIGEDDTLEQNRINLQNKLPIREDIELTITTPKQNIYQTYGRVINFELDYPHQHFSQFTIDFLCNDVYFLDTVINEQIINRYSGGGGFILPVILPILFGGGIGDQQVNNGGTEVIYPVIEIHGKTTQPNITLLDTGESVSFNLNTFTGDKIIVDNYNRTATLNGASIMGFRNQNSTWWGLQPGNNMIRFNTSTGDDDGFVKIIWRNAILTI